MQIFRRFLSAGALGAALAVAGSATAFEQSGSSSGFDQSDTGNTFESPAESSEDGFQKFVPSRAPKLGDLTDDEDADLKAFRDGSDAYRRGNFKKALRNWTRLANRGDVFAQWRLGNMHRKGTGVERNAGKAFDYYRRCAEQHRETSRYTEHTRVTVDCYVQLAHYFRTGIKSAKIKRNLPHALKLYKFTATHFGHPGAQYSIGRMYLTGKGLRKNVSKGLRWLNLSAQKRYAPAQAQLGEIYWAGKGVKPNRVRGLMWYMLAQENADPGIEKPIIDRYNDVYGSSNDKERNRAQTMVAGWNERFPAPGGPVRARSTIIEPRE